MFREEASVLRAVCGGSNGTPITAPPLCLWQIDWIRDPAKGNLNLREAIPVRGTYLDGYNENDSM